MKQGSNYRCILKKTEGLGDEFVKNKGALNAFIGVSLGKELFTRKGVIIPYLQWATKYGKNVLVLIGDTVHTYDYMAFKNLAIDEAFRRATMFGKGLKKKYQNIIDSLQLGENVRVKTWEEVKQDSVCADMVEALVKLDSPAFLQGLDVQLHENIGSKIKELEESLSPENLEARMKLLRRYLVEEIAVMLYLYEFGAYPVMIYPAPAMKIIVDVYASRYPEVWNAVKLNGQWGRVYLDVVPVRDE